MNAAQLIIDEILARPETIQEGIQLKILMNKNIDHDQVAEYTSCHLNESYAAQLKDLIRDGWNVFRIQTEFGIIGHSTVVYLAKMKTS